MANVHGMLSFWASPTLASPQYAAFSAAWQASAAADCANPIFDAASAFPTHGVGSGYGGLIRVAGLFGPP
eukprot:329381-Prymnesium_polylepis.1